MNKKSNSIEAEHLRDMARQFLSPGKGAELFNFAADAIDQNISLRERVAELELRLFKFNEALEREKGPEWEKEHKDLADDLDAMAKCLGQANPWSLERAARELRYMADCFTLKANFVPTDLKIKDLESQLSTEKELRLVAEKNLADLQTFLSGGEPPTYALHIKLAAEALMANPDVKKGGHYENKQS